MQLLKLSFLIMSLGLVANERFTSIECLQSEYTNSVDSKGMLFNLFPNKFSVTKNKCQVALVYSGILETKWSIDLCRDPIHMKVFSKGVESVVKKTQPCDSSDQSDFCYYLKELNQTLEDYGLIHARGLKERLVDPHGQVYCVKLLLKKYFSDEHVFSLFETTPDLYAKKDLIKNKQDTVAIKKTSSEKAPLEIDAPIVDESDLKDKMIAPIEATGTTRSF